MPKVLKMHVDVKPRSMPPNAVYVGRPSKWQNNFPITSHLSRDQVCDLHIEEFIHKPNILKEAREELVGKDLVCYCHPQSCHADFLLRVSNMSKYAGIGSRETPLEILDLMFRIANYLERHNYLLRSGGADGADRAFYSAIEDKSHAEIFVPWEGYNGFHDICPVEEKHYAAARTVHPIFDKLKQGAQKLHARNSQIILGANIDDPVDFVVCWTKGGEETRAQVSSKTGGTGVGISLASEEDIPVFNLANHDAIDRLIHFIGGYKFAFSKVSNI